MVIVIGFVRRIVELGQLLGCWLGIDEAVFALAAFKYRPRPAIGGIAI